MASEVVDAVLSDAKDAFALAVNAGEVKLIDSIHALAGIAGMNDVQARAMQGVLWGLCDAWTQSVQNLEEARDEVARLSSEIARLEADRG